MAEKDTKRRFLEAAGELFRRQGYSGTGLKQIAAHAKAPWGSMYYFFPDGKEQLGAEAVLHAGEIYSSSLKSAFATGGDPVAVVATLFREEARLLEASEFRDSFHIAWTAVDVASTTDRVRAACSTVFREWADLIARPCAAAGLSAPEAEATASFVLSSLEGAIIISRTHKSVEPLRMAGEMVEIALKQIFAKARPSSALR
jgi:TetR/AcrR family transcriptional repressor of lmrAB and yxaGH operons